MYTPSANQSLIKTTYVTSNNTEVAPNYLYTTASPSISTTTYNYEKVSNSIDPVDD